MSILESSEKYIFSYCQQAGTLWHIASVCKRWNKNCKEVAEKFWAQRAKQYELPPSSAPWKDCYVYAMTYNAHFYEVFSELGDKINLVLRPECTVFEEKEAVDQCLLENKAEFIAPFYKAFCSALESDDLVKINALLRMDVASAKEMCTYAFTIFEPESQRKISAVAFEVLIERMDPDMDILKHVSADQRFELEHVIRAKWGSSWERHLTKQKIRCKIQPNGEERRKEIDLLMNEMSKSFSTETEITDEVFIGLLKSGYKPDKSFMKSALREELVSANSLRYYVENGGELLPGYLFSALSLVSGPSTEIIPLLQVFVDENKFFPERIQLTRLLKAGVSVEVIQFVCQHGAIASHDTILHAVEMQLGEDYFRALVNAGVQVTEQLIDCARFAGASPGILQILREAKR